MTDHKDTKTSLLRHHIRPMVARSEKDNHRAATPLELLFDLVSVIAIATATAGLHHAIVENHTASGLLSFAMAFFSIWWAWMLFTWFANSYDNDDVVYRFAVFVMMAGSLCLAAGVKNMFANQDFSLGLVGYVIMRVAHVFLLWRAGNHNHERRHASRMFAVGVLLCQVGWVVGFLVIPADKIPLFFFAMVAIELTVPAVVSFYDTPPLHSGHIVERFGLLTIIVLGESLLALTWGIQKISVQGTDWFAVGLHVATGLISMFAMWWIYFSETEFKAVKKPTTRYLWGYSHVIIFAALATFGAGLAVNLDFITHHAHITRLVSNLSLTLPAAGFLFGIWVAHELFNSPQSAKHLVYLLLALIIIAGSFTPISGIVTSAILVLAAVIKSHFYHQNSTLNATGEGA